MPADFDPADFVPTDFEPGARPADFKPADFEPDARPADFETAVRRNRAAEQTAPPHQLTSPHRRLRRIRISIKLQKCSTIIP